MVLATWCMWIKLGSGHDEAASGSVEVTEQHNDGLKVKEGLIDI